MLRVYGFLHPVMVNRWASVYSGESSCVYGIGTYDENDGPKVTVSTRPRGSLGLSCEHLILGACLVADMIRGGEAVPARSTSMRYTSSVDAYSSVVTDTDADGGVGLLKEPRGTLQ